jgi:hypothetical protein
MTMADSADDALQDKEDPGSTDPQTTESETYAAIAMAVSRSAMAVVDQARAVAENAVLALAMRQSSIAPIVPEEQTHSTEAAPQLMPLPGPDSTETTPS